MMGESPTLPVIFQERPEVVVQAERSLLEMTAEQWTVPVVKS